MAMRAGVLLLQLAALISATELPFTLQHTSVVFRHGHRNIMQQYNFDPYSNVSYWPGGIGQITNRGKMQMYQFGQLLKERYRGLLSEQYNPEEVLVRSSPLPRCVNSALCVLAGLFPPEGSEIWNPSLLWQPVPVYAPEVNYDKLIRVDARCPAYDEEFKKQMDSPEIQAFNNNYSDVYHIISEHWKPVHDFVEPNNLHDHFKIEKERGFPLPEWTNNIYPDKLLDISNQYHVFRTYSPLMARLKTGPIIKDIVERMISEQNSSERGNTRLYLYSGHDDTITSLLSVLGLPNRFKVQYGATLFFELHKNLSGTYEVKVFLMASTDDKIIERVQPAGCSAACDLNTFATLMAPFMPTDWDKECQLHKSDNSSNAS